MRRTRLARPTVWVGVVTLALLAAACHKPINELHPSREELKIATKAPLGRVVVDDESRTMYLFEKDESDESYCYGACESVWPPVTTTGMPMVESGLDVSKVSLLRRDDGLLQVVYNGHPLYYYQADTDTEDNYGEEQKQFGAEWYAVTPQGDQAEAEGAGGGSGGSGSSGGSGGGGGY
jgi:predicted lipoprotein with Yx(FWY)xxD motif